MYLFIREVIFNVLLLPMLILHNLCICTLIQEKSHWCLRRLERIIQKLCFWEGNHDLVFCVGEENGPPLDIILRSR